MATVIIETAHADDEVFGCGGTISVLAQDGWEILIRIWTDAGGDERIIQLHNALRELRAPHAEIIRVPEGRDTRLHEMERSCAVAEAAQLYDSQPSNGLLSLL